MEAYREFSEEIFYFFTKNLFSLPDRTASDLVGFLENLQRTQLPSAVQMRLASLFSTLYPLERYENLTKEIRAFVVALFSQKKLVQHPLFRTFSRQLWDLLDFEMLEDSTKIAILKNLLSRSNCLVASCFFNDAPVYWRLISLALAYQEEKNPLLQKHLLEELDKADVPQLGDNADINVLLKNLNTTATLRLAIIMRDHIYKALQDFSDIPTLIAQFCTLNWPLACFPRKKLSCLEFLISAPTHKKEAPRLAIEIYSLYPRSCSKLLQEARENRALFRFYTRLPLNLCNTPNVTIKAPKLEPSRS